MLVAKDHTEFHLYKAFRITKSIKTKYISGQELHFGVGWSGVEG